MIDKFTSIIVIVKVMGKINVLKTFSSILKLLDFNKIIEGTYNTSSVGISGILSKKNH